ncbi:DEAD/DEAH box helicase [Planctopirus hydrillae]|uniref:ATP-dependent RNA helicase DeaD n=1 Tax=Planctopirus hydrillae TaxID=1841610 RepID=A0A1C3E5W2_9PLAN|nr:DEAD/DEAH box helicase [Planctopirus hydrillae]ODA28593.1 RNA helicase [Planctopirus hydrillae]
MTELPADIETTTTFADLNISPPILSAVTASGYVNPTPIQARTIPLLIEGRDVLGMAQTGTGKTAAFAIPMLQAIDLSSSATQVLILAPTRELAMQVAEAFEKYAANLKGLRVAAIYGGQDYQLQFRQLNRGAHVIVGTPGRVMDHIRRGSLKLDSLKGLVLDEADEMLRMGFAEDVEWILEQTPPQRQIALFSATMPDSIRRIAQKHLKNPAEITIKRRTATAETIRQRFITVPPFQKEAVLARILETEPIDAVIIFVKTKSTTVPLAEFLGSQGYRTAALSSDVPQAQRERIVEHLKSGRLDIVIATDVAARGLDVQRITHVINFDLPSDSESYVHRIGRTGRAGRQGDTILFLHPRERFQLRRIEQVTRQPIEPMQVPAAAQVNERRIERFKSKIKTALDHRDLEAFSGIIESLRKESDTPIEQIAAALAVLAAGDAPLLVKDDIRDFNSIETRNREPAPGRGNPRLARAQDADRSMRPRGRETGREERAPRSEGRSFRPMETFRIQVGQIHQVKPANIVGAIANETGLDSSCIGRIEIYDNYSTVDLLAGMPDDVFHSLKAVEVLGQQLNISRATEHPANEEFSARKSKGRFDSKRNLKPNQQRS